jgi:zinc transport system substrate-binding protein
MVNSKKMRIYIIVGSFFTAFFSFNPILKADIKVVTTIQPLHSLVANVMDGSGDLKLILEGSASPHNFTLKPSHAKMIEKADIIFWFGEDLETFLEKPLKSIPNKAKIISFMKLNEIPKLKFREKNIFDHHDDHKDEHKDDHHDDHKGEHKDDHHDDHKDEHKDDHHDDHKDEHKDDHHDDHKGEHKDGHKDEHGHKDAHGHAHGEFDAHLWLDPSNAKIILKEVAHVLSEVDPSNAKKYAQNARNTSAKIDKMIGNIDNTINKSARFITFHDAYQYFEKRFDIASMGTLTVNPDIQPGAKQVSDIQKLIKEKNIKCIFSEPQFNPKLLNMIAKNTNTKTRVFDPLGSTFEPAKSLYFNLIRALASNLKGC